METTMNSLFDLSGRVAVVTGGNGGIGLGMAKGLAEAGAHVAIWARNEEKSARACAEIEALGVEALAVQCDVGVEADIAAALEATLSRFGRVDIGIANAGFGAPGDPLKTSLERWRHVTNVLLDGAFVTMRELANHMVERGEGGKLLGISSITEHFGSPNQAHYAASKAGLSALVRSMAVRLGKHDIQVNSIQPGWIMTDATRPIEQYPPLNDAVMKRSPNRRWGQPADLAGIAVYFASDCSNFHTGDTVRVDGGYSIF
jgi:NAD(P)-dependent dehydrogenase (short-subunit alcohol dehydrogenase family)